MYVHIEQSVGQDKVVLMVVNYMWKLDHLSQMIQYFVVRRNPK